ncbi:Speckle-type POZ protein [Araneus ventricosus]|uniref:Speckle-type POZ protein n=1 Tax=Araneus ventricosus TaxID=182803 RepID=A0A4Y2SZP2_ARAVE|nr:Speckle-type POZ protein [Araneus ventricosus]
MNTIPEFGKLKGFGIAIGKGDIHLRTYHAKTIYYLCTWSIRNFSLIQNACSERFQRLLGFKCKFKLSVDQEVLKIIVECIVRCHALECCITFSTDSGTVLFHKTLDNAAACYIAFVGTVSITGEDFQKLKELPNDTFVLTCRITIRSGVDNAILKFNPSNTAINISTYLKTLEVDVKKYSGAFSKQKVNLCVGEETEFVNKAVLCSRSPVFEKMFGNEMREHENNTVIITDIKMPVLRALVSFLCSGLLPDCNFDFLCDLYYAANKYDIRELHQACVKFLCDKITVENVLRVLKLSLLHNDELLKSVAMTLISANIETVVLTSDWKI